jgi:hypothetical protein
MTPDKGHIISRRWVALDRVQGDGAPFEIQNGAELTPEDIAFLLELLDSVVEEWGDPEGDIAPLRAKLKGKS